MSRASAFAYAQALCGAPLRTLWRMRVLGRERVPRSGPVILASNHVSYLDPPALGVASPRAVRFMAKTELFAIPLLGPAIVACGAFPVDRTRGDVAAIKRGVAVLRSGEALAIFPEGTRNLGGDVVPQDGAALLASLSDATVVPAYIDGTRDPRRLNRITVIFGEPFRPGDGRKARREDLPARTAEIMGRIAALRERIYTC